MTVTERYREVKNRTLRMAGEVRAAEERRTDFLRDIDAYRHDLEVLKQEYLYQDMAVGVLKAIIDKQSAEHLQKLTALLSYGLRSIFFDREYAAEIDLEDRRGLNAAEIYLLEKIDGEMVKSSLDSVGGSIRTIVGFILQVFYLLYYKHARMIFIDEAFGSLADQYIPSLVEFMRQLAEKKGFIFVLITHDERISVCADHTFVVENKEGCATVREVVLKSKGASTEVGEHA